MRFPTLLLTAGLLAGSGLLQAEELPLWPEGKVPLDNGLTGPEGTTGSGVKNVTVPTLTAVLPEGEGPFPAVVLIPGGGYGSVCTRSEGEVPAKMLVARGIAAFIVKYRLPNGHAEIPSTDARRAIRTVRAQAKEFRVDPKAIGAWAFSAGGNLGGTVSTRFDQGDAASPDPIEQQSSRPDFSILFYPVVSMEDGVTHGGSRRNLLGEDASPELMKAHSSELHVSPETPPTFLLHAADDHAVPVENSLRYFSALKKHGVPAECLLFETGGHGPGAFGKNPAWELAFDAWLGRTLKGWKDPR